MKKYIPLVFFLLRLKRERKMSDTSSLFPLFGDPWLSCLLPSHYSLEDCLAVLGRVLSSEAEEFFWGSCPVDEGSRWQYMRLRSASWESLWVDSSRGSGVRRCPWVWSNHDGQHWWWGWRVDEESCKRQQIKRPLGVRWLTENCWMW